MKFHKKSIFKILCVVVLIIFFSIIILFSWTTKVTENLDAYIYALPFKKGTRHRVVQGYGGIFSHTHIAAIDFEMPIGTEVFAARDGIIYSYKNDSNEGGVLPKYKRKANYLIIKHNDGSFGCYWHLKKDGVLVKSGYVKKGQLIALSGSTGFVLRPHLHFSVKRVLNYNMNSFLKTQFQTASGSILLKNWKIYENSEN